jgi:8-oxo-dGTP pyrophosphatase MutT (NUDIX family)
VTATGRDGAGGDDGAGGRDGAGGDDGAGGHDGRHGAGGDDGAGGHDGADGHDGAGGGGEAPRWLTALARSAERMAVPAVLRPPAGGGRPSAVLILFGDGPDGPDLLFVQRSRSLRQHAGQPAFPGGTIDPSDHGPVGAALREAAEEARVDPSGVDVLAVLPELYITRSGFSVTPVLAWWRRPAPVGPGDPAEVSAVARIGVAELAEPASRLSIRYPSGQAGPAFRSGGMLVWGFTALLVDRLLALGGWEQPWDASNPEDLPASALMPAPDPAADPAIRPADPAIPQADPVIPPADPARLGPAR